MKIELTEMEANYVTMLLGADLKRMGDLMDHAISHSTEIMLPTYDHCANVLTKVQAAWQRSSDS